VRYIPYLLELALLVFALVECIQSDEDDRVGLPLILWIILIVVVPIAGPIAWLVVSRARRAVRRPGAGWGPVVPPAPVAPDDDPEFLWRLESQRRRAASSSPGKTPPRGESSPTGPAADESAGPGSDRTKPDDPEPSEASS